ncbi:hypothetical protein LOK49_LG07G00492 [Camellia lanceoleosa]|uniref:Uncharacterized protein n=1 Tax=Camellia lanceoleosa TaxID=1840588 RepID=A0ACC0H5A4_9ERIC|nr:hypothetical protein LOK49_LG07G00492 [Camellia lanceoleosa]
MNLSSLTLESNPIIAQQRSFYGRTIRTCAGSHLLHLHHRKDAVISVQSVASSSSSPSAVAAEQASQGLSRIGKLSQVSGVLGCQWGDEGNGKLVDIMAKHFDIVARCQVYVYMYYLQEAQQRSFYGRTIRTCAGSHLLHLHHRKDAMISVQFVASSSSLPSAVAAKQASQGLSRIGSRTCWVVSGVMKVKVNSSISWLSTSTLSLVARTIRTCAGSHLLHLHHRKDAVISEQPVASSSSSPSAVAAEQASQGLSRIGSLSQVSGVLACQWSDEGKGKLVDILAKHFDIVDRCQRSFSRRTIRTCAGSHLLHLHHRKDAVISVQSVASSSSLPSLCGTLKRVGESNRIAESGLGRVGLSAG